ncbi:MAG: MmgE/PrpD family protein [Pseudolabrys sp.]|nr:MmgE/PrpD family protein [Pseudolabrys sp.]
MTLSREIVRRWQAAKAAPVPDAVLAAARLHCLDAVGVGLAASSLPQGEPYRCFAAGGQGAISLLAGRSLASAADAALVNGGLIHSLEFDDTHTSSIVHGSSVLAATVLAVAQACQASPGAALRAYLIGYEVFIRIGLAAQGGFQANGFQITSVAGPLVSAAIAAELMGASEDESVNAIGIALSQASGVFEFLTNGSSVKSLHPGWAAHAGITAARLAMCGMTGPETAIEGTRGLFAAFARDDDAPARLKALLGDIGSRWHMPDVAFKFLPCCHYLHPFAEAAGKLAAEIADPTQIAEMVLRIAPGAAPIVCEPWPLKQSPPDGHAARWSLPVVTAMRLVDGKVDLDSFKQKASPAVLALAARSRWEPLPQHRFPNAFEAEVECRLADGRTLTARVEDVFGNASRPAGEADVLTKFKANAARCLPGASVRALEAFFLTPGAADFTGYAAALAARTQ